MATKTIQQQLAEGIQLIYTNSIVKKIDKDNFLDIHIPEINEKKGTHLFFNTSKGDIKVGFYCRDADFINDVIERESDTIEAAANGLRIKDNPVYTSVTTAVASALKFLKGITNDGVFISNIDESNTNDSVIGNDDESIVAFVENFGNDGLSDFLENYLESNRIIVLTISRSDLELATINNVDYSDNVEYFGFIEINDWKGLAKLIGKKEADWSKKEFKDEDSDGIVLFYCDGKYVYAFSKPKEDNSDVDHDELIEDYQSLKLDNDTIPQILEELNADKKLKQIEITYYINDYSDLYYGLIYKVNNCNVEVNRVNWYNDSYWTGEIEREDLIEGLTEYVKGNISGLELFESYIHADDWKFDRAGTLDNGVEFSITDLNGLTDIPKNLQDDDGELDVWELSNYVVPEEEDLYDENKGLVYSYEFSINGKTYGLIIDRINVEEIQKFYNFSEFDIDDLDLLSNASFRIENEKVLPGLLYMPNKLIEEGFDETQNPFFFTSSVQISDNELPGFLFVDAQGFHSDCYTENEIKFIFSWEGLININILEEDVSSIKIELISTEGTMIITEPYSKNFKVLLSIYNTIWKDVILRFADEIDYDWDIIQNEMGVTILTFDSQDDYISWISEGGK